MVDYFRGRNKKSWTQGTCYVSVASERRTIKASNLLRTYINACIPGLRMLPPNSYNCDRLYNRLNEALRDALMKYRDMLMQEGLCRECFKAMEQRTIARGKHSARAAKNQSINARQNGSTQPNIEQQPKQTKGDGWAQLQQLLDDYYSDLVANITPRPVILNFFQDAFRELNAHMCNAILQSESALGLCTFSSKENLKRGLGRIIEWASKRMPECKNRDGKPLDALKPVREIVRLMGSENKERQRVADIDAQCPSLTAGQKRMICSKYRDDSASELPGFSEEVCKQLRQREGGMEHEQFNEILPPPPPPPRTELSKAHFGAESESAEFEPAIDFEPRDLCEELQRNETFEFMKRPVPRNVERHSVHT